MPSTAHTLQDFELELQSLRGSVLSMGQVAMKMVNSIGVLVKDNEDIDAELAARQERDLDVAEIRIDQQARTVLLRYQPVASDLREVTSALGISSDLERIGDDARRILIRHERLLPWLVSDTEDSLPQLWRMVHDTLEQALKAFADHDAEVARRIHDRKATIHDKAGEVLQQIGKSVTRNRNLAPYFLEAVGATTSLERIGDQAANIADLVIFIETARDVRHAIHE